MFGNNLIKLIEIWTVRRVSTEYVQYNTNQYQVITSGNKTLPANTSLVECLFNADSIIINEAPMKLPKLIIHINTKYP